MVPMFMDDDDETAQEPKESTSQGFPEPLPNTSEVEEKKENEKFAKCQEDHKEGRQETEIDDIDKSEGVNPLLMKLTLFLLMIRYVCKTHASDSRRTIRIETSLGVQGKFQES
ncbi:hypothetical protein M9H77_30494 [Catharanthus roseus]|uniref:Uncharacterized protein n=1 Tax=Catharanthus roseus TaxID=4058 RepID=A0ACB9ZXF6_CATRO|nr:hypothetical protein M9H77_30494 [Catharanthus roseus]